jgi:hypothetical protein
MTELRSGLPIISFADQPAFERWIVAQPPNAPGLWIKFAKKLSGIVSLSKAEAIDTARTYPVHKVTATPPGKIDAVAVAV